MIFPDSNFKNTNYIKNVLVHSLRTPHVARRQSLLPEINTKFPLIFLMSPAAKNFCILFRNDELHDKNAPTLQIVVLLMFQKISILKISYRI